MLSCHDIIYSPLTSPNRWNAIHATPNQKSSADGQKCWELSYVQFGKTRSATLFTDLKQFYVSHQPVALSYLLILVHLSLAAEQKIIRPLWSLRHVSANGFDCAADECGSIWLSRLEGKMNVSYLLTATWQTERMRF